MTDLLDETQLIRRRVERTERDRQQREVRAHEEGHDA